jgi:hypothetical protein
MVIFGQGNLLHTNLVHGNGYPDIFLFAALPIPAFLMDNVMRQVDTL